MTTLVGINPRSRDGEQDLDAILAPLQAAGRVELVRLETDESLQRAVEAIDGRLTRIVLGGGDGTIHYALKTILDAAVPLGIVPLGTANDFARSLELPLEPVEAATTIANGRTKQVDLGKVNDEYFLNAIGLGVGPKLNRSLDNELKKNLGIFAYMKTFFEVYRSSTSQQLSLHSDHGEQQLRCLQLTVGNGKHYGGGMRISSKATLTDGQLTVLCIKPRGFMNLVRHAFLLRFGPDPEDPQPDFLEVFTTRCLTVKTSQPVKVTADGEQATQTPIECAILPGRLEVHY